MATTSTYPRGLRNNNPGNIRKGGDVFQGEVIPSADAAFKQFRTMAYGYRAMFVTLDTYRRRGLDTIAKIIPVWAPASDGNKPKSYIAQVAKSSGVAADRPLNENSGRDYIAIVAAMSAVENGREADMADVRTGFYLQDRIK
jgi:hypothetical protein